MSDNSKHEKLESFFDTYGDEICKVCPWQKESHHPEVLCEGRYCEEAAEKFAELLEERKAAREMVSAKVWQAWKNAGIDVVSVEGKLYFGSDNDKGKAGEIERVIKDSENTTAHISSQNIFNNYANCFWNKVANQKMIDLDFENAELREVISKRPVLPIPVTKFVRETTADSQFKHIIEECGEVAKELRNGNTEKAALELGDVVTSCFTMFEILGYGEAARSEIFRQTNEKNESRGYFKAEEVAPEPAKVEEAAQKKEPVIVHGCDDCKYGELTSEDEPCKACGGWEAATGDTLPGWEPENG